MLIAFNMWCLWDLGRLCESLYGRWTFGAIYLITGISGGLASVAWHPMIPSVGASGAIFGLVGTLIASLYLGEFNLPSYVIQANLKSLLSSLASTSFSESRPSEICSESVSTPPATSAAWSAD